MQRIVANGKTCSIDVDPGTPLLYVLRDELGLDGPKFGSGLASAAAKPVVR